MAYEIAKREAVPLLISLSGKSGTGKTYSALQIAGGIAEGVDGGKVAFIDTEAGRGSMYADDPDIISAMPNGQYYRQALTEPFTPLRYVLAIQEAIKEKMTVLIIDSASHEWEGSGGCQDIAENNKLRGMPNWAMAKMAHKKLINLLTQCPMHIIFCLRAREKSKPIKNPETGKTEVVDCGTQPIQEKNFMYEMTLSMMMDENVAGKPIITKCPKPLRHLFNGEQALITKDIGVKLREWSESGEAVDMRLRNLMRECKDVALTGSVALDGFMRSLQLNDKAIIGKLSTKDFQAEVRSLAAEADLMIETTTEDDKPKPLFNT